MLFSSFIQFKSLTEADNHSYHCKNFMNLKGVNRFFGSCMFKKSIIKYRLGAVLKWHHSVLLSSLLPRHKM